MAQATLRPAVPAAPLSLRRNFSWTFAGNLIYAGCQWAMLVLIAKLGTPQMVGQFALALAITAPVTLFANLKLRTIQATDARGEYRLGDYLGLRLITIALSLLVILALVVAGRHDGSTARVILTVGVAKAIESMSDLIYGLLQQHERMDWISQSMVIKGLLSLGALGLGVALTHSVLWGAVGLTAAWALVLLGYDLRKALCLLRSQRTGPARPAGDRDEAFRPRWHPPTLLRLAGSALPLGLVVALDSLYTNVPRYFIELHYGERELGLFAAIGYLMVAGSTVINALGQSASPRLAKYYAAGNRAAFDRLLLQIIGIGAVLGAAGVGLAAAGGRPLLSLIYRPEYARHADLFLWLMATAAVQYAYVFLGTAVNAMRRFTVQLPVQTAGLLVTLLLCLGLVRSYGLKGAAWSMLGAALFEAAAYAALTLQGRRRHLSSFIGLEAA